MSSSPSFCGIWDIRHISKPSEVWCPQCEEGLAILFYTEDTTGNEKIPQRPNSSIFQFE
jgi:hypothetical protein